MARALIIDADRARFRAAVAAALADLLLPNSERAPPLTTAAAHPTAPDANPPLRGGRGSEDRRQPN